MYIFVYEKINRKKVLSGSTQYSKHEIFVLIMEKVISWNYSYKCALSPKTKSKHIVMHLKTIKTVLLRKGDRVVIDTSQRLLLNLLSYT